MSESINDLTISPINKIATSIRSRITQANARELLGDSLFAMAKSEASYAMIVTMAVSEDCLRVVLWALFADGEISDSEAAFVHPFLKAASSLFAKARTDYEPFGNVSAEDVLKFLKKYRDDKNAFGFECKATTWSGIGICRRIADSGQGSSEFTNHCNMLYKLGSTIAQMDGVSTNEQKFLTRLKEHLRSVSAGIGGKSVSNQPAPKQQATKIRPSLDLPPQLPVQTRSFVPPAIVPLAAPIPSEATAPQPAGNLVQCSDCGRNMSKRASACPHCGAPNDSTGISCPFCNSSLPDYVKTCPKCTSEIPWTHCPTCDCVQLYHGREPALHWPWDNWGHYCNECDTRLDK